MWITAACVAMSAMAAEPSLRDGVYVPTKDRIVALVVREGFIGITARDASTGKLQEAQPRGWGYELGADGYLYFRVVAGAHSRLVLPGLNCQLRWTGAVIECKYDDGRVTLFARAA